MSTSQPNGNRPTTIINKVPKSLVFGRRKKTKYNG